MRLHIWQNLFFLEAMDATRIKVRDSKWVVHSSKFRPNCYFLKPYYLENAEVNKTNESQEGQDWDCEQMFSGQEAMSRVHTSKISIYIYL